MERPEIQEKKLSDALFQFLFPFSLNENCQDALTRSLKKDGYQPFSLKDLDLETAYYGDDYQVSHHRLERYFLPYTNHVIFPKSEEQSGFHRYSKSFGLTCTMKTPHDELDFTILSVDVLLCPFDIGFVLIRTQLPCAGRLYTQALEFASRFRVLQNIREGDRRTTIGARGSEYDEVEGFVFDQLVPGMINFLDQSEMTETYFEKLPFFVDERMYVMAMISLQEDEEITSVDCYRGSRLDGKTKNGEPYISASSMEYIQQYCGQHAYSRWAPDTYFLLDENSFICLTRSGRETVRMLGSHMLGEYYYGLLIHFFYKIVLLKLSIHYSHVQLDQNQEEIEKLIRSITTFTAKYYFLEIVSQTQGKEIILLLRNHFGNDELYADVKQTLGDLYKYQENFTSKRSSYLLLILTIYTVISGIYGMNQVIEDLKGPMDWNRFANYSLFEYLALGVTFTGIAIALALGGSTLYRLLRDFRKKKEF